MPQHQTKKLIKYDEQLPTGSLDLTQMRLERVTTRAPGCTIERSMLSLLETTAIAFRFIESNQAAGAVAHVPHKLQTFVIETMLRLFEEERILISRMSRSDWKALQIKQQVAVVFQETVDRCFEIIRPAV